ncbi:MAG: RNAse [Rickettsiaceae bacterium]|nr:RNAse [Rickettsiaceae bacterium]
MKSTYRHKLEPKLQYQFRNPNLLIESLSRKSAVNEDPSVTIDNQRLEYLGDKVLGLVISEILMEMYPDYSAGQLTQLTSELVSNDGPMIRISDQLGVAKFLIMGKGEEKERRNKKLSVDALEAIIGAIYLDSDKNLKIVKSFILLHWEELDKTPLPELLSRLEKMKPKNACIHDCSKEAIILNQKIESKIKHKSFVISPDDSKAIFKFNCIIDHAPHLFENYKDWQGSVFSSQKFDGYNFNDGLEFDSINFSNAIFKKTSFYSCYMRKVNFTDADFGESSFNDVSFINCNFDNAQMQNATFTYCSMDVISRRSYHKAVVEGRARKVDIEINKYDLINAVEESNLQALMEMIGFGGKANSFNQYHCSLLHIAAGRGEFDICKFLIEKGANVNAQVLTIEYDPRDIASDGYTQSFYRIGKVPVILGGSGVGAAPIHIAAGNGHRDITELLLQNGAQKDNPYWRGLTPALIANKLGHSEIADLLERY